MSKKEVHEIFPRYIAYVYPKGNWMNDPAINMCRTERGAIRWATRTAKRMVDWS